MLEIGTRIVDTETGVRGIILKRVDIQYPGMKKPIPGYKVVGEDGFFHAVRCSATHILERPSPPKPIPKKKTPHPILPGLEEFLRP
jgi:hypothetical protein